MEIAFLVIAVIGLLALSGGGSFSAKVSAAPTNYSTVLPPQGTYVPITAAPQQPYAYTPSPAAPYQPPMTPSTSAPIDGALLSGGAQIGTATFAVATHAGTNAATSAASALPIVGAVIAVGAAIASALLAAHRARLVGATNENQAVDQWVPVFDSFIQQSTSAYNAGQINATQLAQLMQQFDQTLYNKFRSFVGQPGTRWTDSVGQAGQCNSDCTVACCVYWQDLSVVLNDISYVVGFPTGKWGQGDPRISGRTVTAPKVYPSKYSSYTRESYSITLN